MEIVKTILNLLGKGEEMIEYVEDRKGHDRRYAIDFSKIKNELGFEPQVTFEEGIAQTLAWFQANEAWWKNIKSGEYEKYYAKQYSK